MIVRSKKNWSLFADVVLGEGGSLKLTRQSLKRQFAGITRSILPLHLLTGTGEWKDMFKSVTEAKGDYLLTGSSHHQNMFLTSVVLPAREVG